MKHTILTVAFTLLALAPAAAQQAPRTADANARWQPWLGCWHLLGETVTGQTLEPAAAASGNPRRALTNAATRVCVARAGDGVTLTTTVGGQTALEESVAAGGGSQPIQDADCRGVRTAEWSPRAPRLYSTADITCADQAPRRISSVSMMTPGPTWVDIQVIDISGRKNIRIRRYQRADEPPAHATGRAPVAFETSWSVEDVKEASRKVPAEAVQAALVEFRQGFNLKGKQLLDLDRAGVPDSIVDLMVALSYPKRFQIERAVAAPGPGSSGFGTGYGYGTYDSYDPMWPFYLDSAFWSTYYSPFAYRYWGLYDPYYFANSGYVVIGQPGQGGGDTPVASGAGRVVDGRGYTRVTTRESERVNGGGSNGIMSTGGSSTGGSSGGTSGVSSGGYSGGGGDGGGGRTAVPRQPGER